MIKNLFLTKRTLSGVQRRGGKKKKKKPTVAKKDAIQHSIIYAFANGEAILDELDKIGFGDAFVVSFQSDTHPFQASR